MRIKRLLVSLAAAPALLLSVSTAPASADTPAPGQEYCSSTGGGLYFSPFGKADVMWAPHIRQLVQQFGATWDAFKPVTRILSQAGEDLGITMPIGMQHDSIGFDGRICYPGGFSITQTSTGKHARIDDGFAVRIFPCGAFAKPVINGVRWTKEVQLASCFAPEVLVSVAGIKDGGLGGGVTPWHFNVSPFLAEQVNQILGQPVLKAGEPLFTLAPVLKFLPFRAS
ncbi:hypothetical protein ACIBG8_34780 [Nonomuraea sp. NPDC050556]|uniref:hypothetical protein n=1 Tax=Nonomuraea sp. NPDC050556 TaxID=3364369 RepID=UPI0037A9C776